MFLIGFGGSATFTTGFNQITYLPDTLVVTMTEKINNITSVVQSVSTQVTNIVNSATTLLASVSDVLPVIEVCSLPLALILSHADPRDDRAWAMCWATSH
jgi:hypothetical protein